MTSFVSYNIVYTQTILVIMVLRDCYSKIFNDFKKIFESKTRSVFCMLSLVEKKCVPVRSENRESGPTAFQIIFLVSLNSRKN